jgi:acetyltransferase
MFNPRSVAVIGASDDPLKIGYRPIQNCLKFGFKGKLFPVNPKYKTVAGVLCYPNLNEIKEEIDLAVISVPVNQVLKALEDCITKGVKAAVIYSSGFSEVGEVGKRLQDQIRELIQAGGLRVCGPNCQGIANLYTGLNVSFSTCFLRYGAKLGPLGLVTQSGMVGGLIYPLGLEHNLGFSYWISIGNEVDLDFADCVTYLAQDENTQVILGYLENIRDGRKLQKAVRIAHQQEKPVLIVLAGRTAVGARAALSHTGSLAGDDRLTHAVLKQMGILRVYDLQELMDSANLLARSIGWSGKTAGSGDDHPPSRPHHFPTSRPKLPEGRRVGIITNSGGTGVMMADTCVDLGLEVPSFSEDLQEKIARIIPVFGSPRNPIDMSLAMLDQPEVLPQVVRLLDQEGPVDTIVVFLGMMGGTYPLDKIVPDLIHLSQTTTKPLLVTWMVGVQDAFQKLQTSGVIMYKDPTQCLKSLATLVRYADWIRESKEDMEEWERGRIRTHLSIPSSAHPLAASLILDEHTSKKLLACYGIPSCREKLTSSEEEAVLAAQELGYPVVLKVCSAEIPHKSELGLVKVSLSNSEEVRRAYQNLMMTLKQKAPQAKLQGILVQEMITEGVEMALGVIQDSRFGPVILCGLGGIFIEILKDISWRMAPVNPPQARSMLQELQGYPLLTGVRGKPPADLEALIDTIVRLSQLAMELSEEVKEIDLNPLMVLSQGKGVKTVDALMILRPHRI